jgi:hypothetical protein
LCCKISAINANDDDDDDDTRIRKFCSANHGRATFLALKHEPSIMSDTLHDDAAMHSHLPALGERGKKSSLRSVPGIIIHPRPPPVLLLVRNIAIAPTTTTISR